MNKIGIISTGRCIGEIVETNEELSNKVKNFDSKKGSLNDWIQNHYGIESRVITKKMPSELAVIACEKALKKAKIKVTEIDFLILNTTSGDFKQPTTATNVQGLLGMRKDSFAIEINMPCSGNIYGLATAYSYINTGLGKVGLVVGVDKMTSIIDNEDFKIASMFGDAASASIIGHNPLFAIKNIFLQSKQDLDIVLGMKSSGSKHPLSTDEIEQKNHLLSMKGKETSTFIMETIEEVIHALLKKSNLKMVDVDQFVIHQASKVIIKKTVRNLGILDSQLFFTIEKLGNTSSASILLTLDTLLEKKPDLKNIFLIGMGSGLNWGGIYLRKT
jgi:3-oxoacyl-(acyl-carrier-protein) synthase III